MRAGEASARLLADHGPESLTVSAVAHAAEINRTTAYQHFRTREELVRGVTAELIAEVRTLIGESRVLDRIGLKRSVVLAYLTAVASAGAMALYPDDDLAAWIASRPDLTVVAQKADTVGGLAGTQLDVRTGSKGVEFGPITGVTDPGMGIGANDTVRLIVVPVAGRQVLIMLRAEDGSIEEIQPLADSIVWR